MDKDITIQKLTIELEAYKSAFARLYENYSKVIELVLPDEEPRKRPSRSQSRKEKP